MTQSLPVTSDGGIFASCQHVDSVHFHRFSYPTVPLAFCISKQQDGKKEMARKMNVFQSSVLEITASTVTHVLHRSAIDFSSYFGATQL